MRFFWVTDQVKRKQYLVHWHPGQENLADYFTKHFEAKHHIEVHTLYLHEKDSPWYLLKAPVPSALQEYVGNPANGYGRTNELPPIMTS